MKQFQKIVMCAAALAIAALSSSSVFAMNSNFLVGDPNPLATVIGLFDNSIGRDTGKDFKMIMDCASKSNDLKEFKQNMSNAGFSDITKEVRYSAPLGHTYSYTLLRVMVEDFFHTDSLDEKGALKKDFLKVIGWLLEAGVDPNKACHKLNEACLHSYFKNISSNGAFATLQEKQKKLLLKNGREAVLIPLLKKGANPNCKEVCFGKTPLHIAAELNLVEECKLLIEYGAKLNIKNNKGVTPYDILKKQKWFETWWKKYKCKKAKKSQRKLDFVERVDFLVKSFDV